MQTQLARILTLSAILSTPLIASVSPGEELWMAHCKKCHGEDGKGETAMGKRFDIRDYTDKAVQETLTDEAIRTAIVEGLKNEDGKVTMLPLGKKLSSEEVDILVGYVRSIAAE